MLLKLKLSNHVSRANSFSLIKVAVSNAPLTFTWSLKRRKEDSMIKIAASPIQEKYEIKVNHLS